MTEVRTIREALTEAAEWFVKIKAAVFTTFNFQPEFFENNVLPSLFCVETDQDGARRVSVNEQLSNTQVSVLYDASTVPKGGGTYRYQQHGIFVSPHFFHPKLIFVAGDDRVEGKPWLYLAVSSANLTLSAWGKNQEVFGELWIGSTRQTLHNEVKSALEWLQKQLQAKNNPSPAINLCLQILDGMGGSTQAEFTTNASFYFSPLHKDGFWPVLQAGQTQKWDRLSVLSPYWGSVDENLEEANAREYVLIPALLDDGKYGLGRDSVKDREDVELCRLARRDDIRFWHAKAYFLERKNRLRIGIGSGNFTDAGLAGGGKGNVEAMLIYEPDAGTHNTWIPELVRLDLDDGNLPDKNADGSPEIAPVVIIVVYDWRERKYRVIFEPEQTPGSGDYRLRLPGLDLYNLENESADFSLPDPKGPLKGTMFQLEWQRNGDPRSFSGLINEVNLEHSDKQYTRQLTLSEILNSWHSPSCKPPPPKGGDGDGDGDGNGSGSNDKAQKELAAEFDVLNLYDMYRAFLLRSKKIEEEIENDDFDQAVSYLLNQTDSVYRLAKMAGEQAEGQAVESPIKRYLVLMECRDMIEKYRRKLPGFDVKFARDVSSWFSELQQATIKLGDAEDTERGGAEVLGWLENELKKAWRS